MWKRDHLIREQAERRMRVGCIADRAVFIFGGDRLGARQWLNATNPGLDNQSPLEFAHTEESAERVEELITRIEHWIVGWHPSEAQAMVDWDRRAVG